MYVNKFLKSFPKTDFTKEINDHSKQNWSKESYKIAKDFAYTLKEGHKPTNEYISKGKDITNKQLVLAGYRLSNLISYLMSKQVKTEEINHQVY